MRGHPAWRATLARRLDVRALLLSSLALAAAYLAAVAPAPAQVSDPDSSRRCPRRRRCASRPPRGRCSSARARRAPAARRPLVLPPGRHLRRRGRAAGTPRTTSPAGARHGAAQLERHRHDRRTVPPWAGTARSSGCRSSAEEGRCTWKVRFEGGQLPHDRLAERAGARGRSPATSRSSCELEGLRKGRNTLVVKVTSLRSRTDLTHWRPAAFNGFGTGGWWNFGGLLREVYVRPVDTVDVEHVQAVPRAQARRRPGAGGGAHDAAEPHRRRTATWRSSISIRGRATTASRPSPRRCPPAAGACSHRDVRSSSNPRLWQPRTPDALHARVSVTGQAPRRRKRA